MSALPNPLVPVRREGDVTAVVMSTNTASASGSTCYGSSATDAEIAWLRRCLPIFVQPDIDIKNRNELVKVFFRFERQDQSGQLDCKLCIVFAGESCYNRVQEELENTMATICYRTFNRRTYKRTADINYMEFRNVNLDPNAALAWATIYTQDHGGAQQWAQGEKRDVGNWFSLMHHYHAEVPFADWKLHEQSSRPYIWLNTCNHMIGQQDNNPRLSKFDWTDYPFQEGDGDDAFHYVVDHVPTKCNLYSYLCFWSARNGGGCCDRHQGGKTVSRDGKSIFMKHPSTSIGS
ncbi:hypothetical protein BBJ28_00006428 [Nothophytophthora sp. Chile5]|nr:hypothetical protein BBJ28_00006428 [Nothophytophthora sp. Chile5]